MTIKPRIGKDCFLYYSVAWATPTLLPIPNAVDVTQPGIQKNKVGLPSRGSGGWNPQGAGLKSMDVEFGYLYESDTEAANADAAFLALQDSFHNDTPLIFYVLDGPGIAADAPATTRPALVSEGYLFPAQVFDFPTKEELENGKMFDVGAAYTRYTEASTLILPEWYEVTLAAIV